MLITNVDSDRPSRAQGIQCLSNLKQLQIAWRLYSDDFNDFLVPNTFYATNQTAWVRNLMNFNPANTDNTNVAKLLGSLLSRYTESVGIHHCPSDRSVVHLGGRAYGRVRSVSMNNWMASLVDYHHGFRTYWRQSEILMPTPTDALVFLDEREDSIDASHFIVTMRSQTLTDYPSSYHNGAGNVSFADGHAEAKRWLDPRTRPPLRPGVLLTHGVASPNNPDLFWLQEHASTPELGNVGIP